MTLDAAQALALLSFKASTEPMKGTCISAAAILLLGLWAKAATTLYVSSGFQSIYQVDAAGAPTVFATLPAANSGPAGLAFDSSGNLYAAANTTDEIFKITPTGTVSLFASLPSGSGINGLAIDSSGDLYAACYLTNQINKITSAGAVSLFVTLPASGPVGLAFDGSGNLYASGADAAQITKITPTGTASLFASLAPGSRPFGLAFDGNGNLYTADFNNDLVSKIAPSGAVSTFANLPSGAGGEGLAFDSSGNLYVASVLIDEVEKVTPDGSSVSPITTLITNPAFIVVAEAVPEPTRTLLFFASLGLLIARRRRWN